MDDKRYGSFNIDLEKDRATLGVNDCTEDTAFSLIHGLEKPEEVKVSFGEHGELRSFHYQGHRAEKLLAELQSARPWTLSVNWNLVNGMILVGLLFLGAIYVSPKFQQRPATFLNKTTIN